MTDRRVIADTWRRLDVAVRDLPLGLVLFTVSFLPLGQAYGTIVGGLPDRPFDPLAALVIALQSLSLALRRRTPLLCLVLVATGFAVDQLQGYHTFAAAGLVVALVSAGAHLDRHRRLAAVLFSAAYVLFAAGMYRAGSVEPLSEFVEFYVALAFAVGVGVWQRSVRLAEQERLQRVASETRALERTRIARDLHDVVTHHVTAMVVQAEAARYLTASPQRMDETLETIAGTGRRAISDLRQVLEILNPDHEHPSRTPGTTDVRELVKHARGTGMRIDFTQEGTPEDASGSTGLVLYRVVQEALTNARKHAPGGRTAIAVDYRATEVAVSVSTEPLSTTATVPAVPELLPLPSGTGHGLMGLSARVSAVGGDFSAGPSGDGFVVCARIPRGGR